MKFIIAYKSNQDGTLYYKGDPDDASNLLKWTEERCKASKLTKEQANKIMASYFLQHRMSLERVEE